MKEELNMAFEDEKMQDIILIGCGGHSHSVTDCIEQTGIYNIIGFLDTIEMQGKRFRDYYVLDTDDSLQKYFDEGIKNAFITIGYMGHGNIRNNLYRKLKEIGYAVPNIIDNTAVIARSAKLGDGIFVGKNAVINANATIGNMCIINTGAIVEHDCEIGDFSHIAVGSVLCGTVSVGKQTFIGANATVIQERKIGNHCIIGAGTTIRKNVEEGYIVTHNGKTKIQGNDV